MTPWERGRVPFGAMTCRSGGPDPLTPIRKMSLRQNHEICRRVRAVRCTNDVFLASDRPEGSRVAGLGRRAHRRRPAQSAGRRLEEVAKAVGGGYCRLQMPSKLKPAVRGTVAGHRLGGPGEGGGVPPPFPMHPWAGGGYLPPFQCIPGRGGVPPPLPMHRWGGGVPPPFPMHRWARGGGTSPLSSASLGEGGEGGSIGSSVAYKTRGPFL